MYIIKKLQKKDTKKIKYTIDILLIILYCNKYNDYFL